MENKEFPSETLSKLSDFFGIDQIKKIENEYINSILSGKNTLANTIKCHISTMKKEGKTYYEIVSGFEDPAYLFPTEIERNVLYRIFKELGFDIEVNNIHGNSGGITIKFRLSYKKY